MPEQRDPAPYAEPPEAGVGGEGPIVDLTGLAPTTDAEMAQAVRAALVLDPDVEADNFRVDAENGVVSLSGRARSSEERRRAIEAASRVRGVRRVVDRLAG
jgi:osmotically-inducible protein OsmY